MYIGGRRGNPVNKTILVNQRDCHGLRPRNDSVEIYVSTKNIIYRQGKLFALSKIRYSSRISHDNSDIYPFAVPNWPYCECHIIYIRGITRPRERDFNWLNSQRGSAVSRIAARSASAYDSVYNDREHYFNYHF